MGCQLAMLSFRQVRHNLYFHCPLTRGGIVHRKRYCPTASSKLTLCHECPPCRNLNTGVCIKAITKILPTSSKNCLLACLTEKSGGSSRTLATVKGSLRVLFHVAGSSALYVCQVDLILVVVAYFAGSFALSCTIQTSGAVIIFLIERKEFKKRTGPKVAV